MVQHLMITVRSMFAASLLVASVGATAAQQAVLPPRQSALQAAVLAGWRDKAIAASRAATPELLHLLQPGGKVQRLLGDCCPSLVGLSASELASIIRAEASAAELTHNFAHFNSPSRWENDVDLLTLANASYFYNLDELAWLHLARGQGAGIPAGAETTLMHFPPFSGGTPTRPLPASFDEASQRPVYGLLNLLAIDNANPLFGDVGFVFRNTWVRNSTLFFPTDTGNWVTCNASHPSDHCGFPNSLDLSAWPSRTPGISGHLDHILVAFERSFSGRNRCSEPAFVSPLALVLRRLFGRDGAASTMLSSHSMFMFIEADIVASPHFPASVSHVVAGFHLVGTLWGDRLRALCAKNGWPLMWALGPNDASNGNASLEVVVPSQRLIDSVVCRAPATSMARNISSRCDTKAFDKLWQQASRVNITARSPRTLSSWWQELVDNNTGIVVSGPVRHGQCAAESCFGIVACPRASKQQWCCACQL